MMQDKYSDLQNTLPEQLTKVEIVGLMQVSGQTVDKRLRERRIQGTPKPTDRKVLLFDRADVIELLRFYQVPLT